MRGLIEDFRFGLRILVRKQAFTLIAALTLALGIGANTAVFSVVNAVLLRPLPGIADPGRLVTFYRLLQATPFDSMGYPDYLDYRDRTQSLSGLAAHVPSPSTLRFSTAERVRADVVTGNYFDVLGVKPAVGRLLTPDDDRAPHPFAVLSYGLWQRKFGGNPHVAGTTIELNTYPFTVVGVAAREFGGTVIGDSFDLWVPLSTVRWSIPRLSQGILQDRAAGWLEVFGRLKPEAGFRQAEAEMQTIAGQLAETYPATNGRRSLNLVRGVGLYPDDRAEVGGLLGLLTAAVGLLLLIACANVAGLFLVRASGRQREIAVRLAVGAGRSRIIRQLLTEGVLLSLAAGALGLLLAEWIAVLPASLRPPNAVLHKLDVSIDGRVLGFTLLASLATGILFALLPALRTLRLDLTGSLKDGGRGTGRRRSRWQPALAAAQVAVSFILLTAAGMLVGNLHRLVTSSPGYETTHVAMGSLDLITMRYSAERGSAVYRQLLDRLPGLPGVVSATLALTVPPQEWPGSVAVFYPGQEPPPDVLRGREFETGLRVDINRIAPAYFRTLGIPLLAGRDFTAQDRAGAPAVAIVNQKLAARLWPGESPVGRRISAPSVNGPPRAPLEVVGVAADTRSRALTGDAPLLLYLPVFQDYDGRAKVVVRTSGDPGGAIAGMERVLAAIDPNLALYGAETMSGHVAQSLWQQRMAAGWIGAFSLLALLLAAVGLYGVVSQTVAQRTWEMGVRMALGAAPAAVARLVIRDGMLLAAAGLAIGLPVSLGFARATRGFLAGMNGAGLLSFLGTALLLAAVMLVACWIPARRAARVDPVEALRCE